MSSEIPLVTAIMPTRGRREWAADAVRMFLRQSWPAKELVIVDDMTDLSFLHASEAFGVQYHRRARLNIGAKRNLAISLGLGAIIMHWDSDDIYSDDRMMHQANLLIGKQVDMVGYHTMEFVDVAGPRYLYKAAIRYAIGVSMCYWRDTWEARRFDPVDAGEDNAFLAGRTVYCCPADGRIIARIHGGNTSSKRDKIGLNKRQWERIA